MILTIRQYIEALSNPEGRFRTLDGIYPVNGENGEPLFSVPVNGVVDFEVVAAGRPMTLRCPLRCDASTRSKLCSFVRRDEGLESEFFIEWVLRENEAVLFDDGGNPVETDLLVRPAVEGVTAEEFLGRAVETGDMRPVAAAIGSLASLAEWLEKVGREAAAGSLLFTADGSVRVAGFSARGGLGDVALAFFFTAVLSEMFAEVGRPMLTKASVVRPMTVGLCAGGAALGFPEPKEILDGDVAGALARLAAYSAEDMARLGRRLSGHIEIPRPEPLLQPAACGYAWTEAAPETDGMRCVMDGGGWHYVAHDGTPAIDRSWPYAAPFREGRAEVETEQGRGLIDKEGHYVLEPVYEELVWDEYWGVVAVMEEGRWSLLDREGKMLTDTYYDWLGECSEGLILAQKDGKCGFIDTLGREAIPFAYDDATSFSEGCAFVTIGGGRGDGESFYIDSRGVRL